MRKALAMLALLVAGLWAAPTLAATSPAVDRAAWVKVNTDLVVSQVAIAGPENVYSLEPMGPRLPTGEVLALVRTEAVSDDWRAAHQFQSWDAHMLFDCQGGRVRVLRSTSYLERDRQGAAKADERGDAWFSPQPETPAATLLAAACDPGFRWPLRGSAVATPVRPTETTPPVQTTVATATAPALPVQAKPLAADRPVVLARAEPARTAPMIEKAASPDMAQFASPASARSPSPLIQKASFIKLTTLQAATSPPKVEAAAPRRLSTAATACKRLVGAGGGWLWRHVERAFHREGAPFHPNSGVIRQAQLS